MPSSFSRLNMEYPLATAESGNSSDVMIPEHQSTFDGVLPQSEPPRFFEKTCAQLCGCWFGLVLLGLIIGIVFFIIFPIGGIIVVAMTPAVAILGITRHLYFNQVTIGQMIVSFLETIMWMLPLLLWDLIWFAIDRELDKDSGVCFLCLLAYFLQAYFFAGFCEEFVKFLVIARLTNSLLTKDWRTMMIYGICSGAGFATLENLMYVFQFGVATGVVRGFVSVPLHCTTAAIIGLNLANKRPIDTEGQGCIRNDSVDAACAYLKIVPSILLVPWLIHGTFDFCLMVSAGAHTKASFVGFIVAFLVFAAGLAYARHLTLYTLAHNPLEKINIHAKIASENPRIIGENRISSCIAGSTQWVCDCCCLCSCCCPSTPHDLSVIQSRNNYNTAMNNSGSMNAPLRQNSGGYNQSNVVYVHTV